LIILNDTARRLRSMDSSMEAPMTPLDDDLPPPRSRDTSETSAFAWLIAGAALVLLFTVAVMFVRPAA
jgi:hypothetical protein